MNYDQMLLLLLFLRSDTVSASQTFLLIISSVSSRVSHSVWAQKPFWSEVWDLKYFCSVLILALYTLTGLELLCICVSPELQRRTRGFEDTWLLVQHEHPPVETQARLSRSWNSMTDWLSVQLPKYTEHLTVTRQTQHSRTHNTHNDHQSSSSSSQVLSTDAALISSRSTPHLTTYQYFNYNRFISAVKRLITSKI